MPETRRRFNRNFSEGAVRLMLETGQPIAARGEGQGVLSEDERAELVRLRRENAELQMQRDALKRTRLGIIQSMGRPGSALDKAAIGSWHFTATFELLGLEHFATNVQGPRHAAPWINEYNRDRRRSALGMVSPIAFELADAVPAAGSLPPSSPASSPSPAGGLRPALTPAPDDSPPRPRGRSAGNADRPRSA
jgi:Integrase core domain